VPWISFGAGASTTTGVAAGEAPPHLPRRRHTFRAAAEVFSARTRTIASRCLVALPAAADILVVRGTTFKTNHKSGKGWLQNAPDGQHRAPCI
jgi:hypothetical protein